MSNPWLGLVDRTNAFTMKLHGSITFEASAVPVKDAVLRLVFEDVSDLDVPARPIAACSFGGISLAARASKTIPYTFEAGLVPVPGRQYQIRAHLDRSGKGQVEAGDFVTTRAYPVDASGGSMRVDLTLEWVGP